MTRRTLLVAAALHKGSKPLFDGVSFRNFRTPTGSTAPDVSWRIHDGILETIPDARRQCDLWTAEAYRNFDLEFDWMVAPGANSGIKYMIQASPVDRLRDTQGEFLHETSLGFEFQLVDDRSPAGSDVPTHASGALYNYLPPARHAAKPAGSWNTARLIVQGNHVEHWVNGKRVLSFEIGSEELNRVLAAKKLNSARLLEKLEYRRTPIAFQHHESKAAFRKIRIQLLTD